MIKNLQTVAVVTRISRLELPYIDSFIKHYVENHEVDKIYFFTEDAMVINNYNHLVELITLPPKHSILLVNLSGLILQTVKEDFLLCVDCDEFLHIKERKSLKTHINNNIKQQKILWAMSVHDTFKPINKGIIDLPISNAFPGHIYKCLVKASLVTSIDEHEVELNVTFDAPVIKRSEAFLLHVWARSFNDAVIKTFLQDFPYQKPELKIIKENTFGTIESVLDARQLPNRLKLLAFFSAKRHNLNISNGNFNLKIDLLEEQKLISKFASNEQMGALYNLYNVFKQKLIGNEELLSLYPAQNLKQIHNHLNNIE